MKQISKILQETLSKEELVELANELQAESRSVARVFTARELEDSEKKDILKKLDTEVKFFVDTSLIGGIKIKFKDREIDHTISSWTKKLLKN